MSRCTSLLAAGSAGLLTIAIAGAAPTATLARSPPRAPKLIVFPVSPKAASGIDMSFRSGGKLVPPSRFQVVIHSGDDQTCSSDVAGVITRVPRRPATIHATLAPTLPSASGSGPRGWCPGTATATLYRFGRTGTTATPLASRAFTISPDPRFIPEPLGTRLRIELLEPSTIELRRQGQPDQRSAITGTLDGFIAGRVLRSADYLIQITGGVLHLEPAGPNDLCDGPSHPSDVTLDANGSSLTFTSASAKLGGTLALQADALGLAGCGTPAPVPSTIAVSGVLGERQLADVALSGLLPALPVLPGLTVAVTLKLRVRISGLDVR